MAQAGQNSHIRRGKRESPDTVAADAKRLLDDPAFQRAFETAKESLVTALENHKPNGTAEQDEIERELCRTLRTLKMVPNILSRTVQGQQLRLADFRPSASGDD